MTTITSPIPIRTKLPSTKLAFITASTALLLAGCSTTPITPAHIAPTVNNTRPTTALVLGGGGARGIAHVGVIKALEDNGIQPDMVVGTSIGSFIGSLYASGKPASELERLTLATRDSDLADFTLSHQGIIEGRKLRNFVNTHVGDRPIESLPIRFGAVATEMHSGKKTLFTTGDTGLVVQASCSVPKIFIAPRIPDKVGKKYVDGGVTSLVPVDSAKTMGADVVIAVDLQVGSYYHTAQVANMPSLQGTGLQGAGLKDKGSIWAWGDGATNDDGTNNDRLNRANSEANRADVVIRPAVLGYSTFDSAPKQALIQAGYDATIQKLPAIRQAMAGASVK